MKSLRGFQRAIKKVALPFLDAVIVTTDGVSAEQLAEGSWKNGRFEKSIRIDNPTHGVGQPHAHIHGRKGNQIGVVNIDGSSSHGTAMRIHDRDADVLRASGFQITDDGGVEWAKMSEPPVLLVG